MCVHVLTPRVLSTPGDEMNVHISKSIAADVELSQLMSVTNCLLSPADNMPTMGIIQDSLLGAYRMSSPNTFINKSLCFDLIFATFGDDFDGKIPPPTVLGQRPLWSGLALLSMLLPTDFSLTLPSVTIRKGRIVSGRLCKKSLGKVNGGIIHRLALHYGTERAAKFITDIQRMTNHYLNHAGFSTGISDCCVDHETKSKIGAHLEHVLQATNTPYIDEAVISRALNQVRDVAAKIAIDEMDTETNGMLAMATAGSKGNKINFAQITTCVGQQTVAGARLGPETYGGRSMPHHVQSDFDPSTRGFCKNSYLRGLKPAEFFAHAQGGRTGLIDTSCKTSSVGYLQRKLAKSMENVAVCYDNTVRDERGYVVQFTYGEDSLDATKLIRIRPGEGPCGNLLRNELYASPFDFVFYLEQLPKSKRPQEHKQNVYDKIKTVRSLSLSSPPPLFLPLLEKNGGIREVLGGAVGEAGFFIVAKAGVALMTEYAPDGSGHVIMIYVGGWGEWVDRSPTLHRAHVLLVLEDHQILVLRKAIFPRDCGNFIFVNMLRRTDVAKVSLASVLADRCAATVLAKVSLASVLADRCAATILAKVSLAPVLADRCTTAILALGSLASVLADRRTTAILALGSSASVLADRRTTAILALGSLASVLADRRTTAILALVSFAPMWTLLSHTFLLRRYFPLLLLRLLLANTLANNFSFHNYFSPGGPVRLDKSDQRCVRGPFKILPRN